MIAHSSSTAGNHVLVNASAAPKTKRTTKGLSARFPGIKGAVVVIPAVRTLDYGGECGQQVRLPQDHTQLVFNF